MAALKLCLFCARPLTPTNRGKEHAIPRWLVKRLGFGDGTFRGRHWNFPNRPRVVLDEREQAALSLVLGHVCQGCNGGWMRHLENQARPLLVALWDGVHAVTLTREQCATLARWTYKTASALNYAVNYRGIIPLNQIRQFFARGRLPENGTVDVAYAAIPGLHWILGGNRIFAARSTHVTRSQCGESYVVTLQFHHMLLRLAWAPIEHVSASLLPPGALHRVSPLNKELVSLRVLRQGYFQDIAQLHFKATVFAEEGVYPDHDVVAGSLR